MIYLLSRSFVHRPQPEQAPSYNQTTSAPSFPLGLPPPPCKVYHDSREMLPAESTTSIMLTREPVDSARNCLFRYFSPLRALKFP